MTDPVQADEFDSARWALSRSLFFIGGQGKSGTTWVQHLLDGHPRICCKGEGHLADGLLPGLAPFHPPDAAMRDTLLRFATAQLLARQCPQAGPGREVDLLGERTPANAGHAASLLRLFPQARFVHVIRDVRDVAVSLWHHARRVGGETRQQYASLESLATALAAEWARGIRQLRVTVAPYADRYREIRYEDLQQDPVTSVRGLLDFLGTDSGEAELAACLHSGSFRERSGGREPGEEDPAAHLRKGVSGDWRNHLDAGTVQTVIAAAEGMLEDLGYDAY
jgi:hypothetical protein